MQAVAHSGPAGLSTRTRTSSGLKATTPARAVRFCRTFKSPIAYKEDDAERLRKAAQQAQPAFAGEGSFETNRQGGTGEVPYKVEDPVRRLYPAFTRRREHFIGRTAMLGVAACWAGEVLTGFGPMQQLANILNISYGLAFWSTVALAVAQGVLGLSKGSPTWDADNQKDLQRRSKGLTGITEIEPDSREKATTAEQRGLRWELALGRTAMLTFAGAMAIEFFLKGGSPLAYFKLIVPGVPMSAAPAWLKVAISLFLAGAVGVFSAFNTNKDPQAY
ncbi:hypothetical protein N2152v2_000571 [Parachlorella kessleri]